MELFLGIASIVAVTIATIGAARLFKAATIVEWVIIGFLAATAQIILGGIILSACSVLGSIYHWTGFTLSGCFLLVLVLLLSPSLRRRCFARAPAAGTPDTLKAFPRELPRFEKIILILLLATLIVTGLLNAGVVIFTAPHNWDSMTFDLARTAYWLQHNNFNYYPTHFWFQVTHQKAKSLLALYLFLATGRNENFTQLVQFSAYLASIFAVYGIARFLRLGVPASLFSALVFALLVECLMESTTTQSDMLLTAYLGAVVYSLFAFREKGERKYLGLSGAGLGLALATKPPALLLFPSLGIVAAHALFSRPLSASARARAAAFLLASALVSTAVFALPTGYGENWRLFGHPMGPEDLRRYHSFEGRSLHYVLVNGTKNLLRYAYDFISLDGLPPVPAVLRAQSALKSIPKAAFRMAGIQLEAGEGNGVREGPFVYDKPPYSHTDYSYWGILGFAFLWPVAILVLCGVIRVPSGRILALGAVLFALIQAFSGPYELARGRYFIEAAIFIAPLGGVILGSSRTTVRAYLAFVVALGCVSALTAVLFRHRSPLLTRDSIFLRPRLEQVLRDGPIFQAPIRKFEELVPPGAVVAVCLNPNSYEYPLFGEGLTRKLIPINSFWQGLQPVPADAEYLLWCDDFDGVFNRNDTDIHLGKDWYLRKLR